MTTIENDRMYTTFYEFPLQPTERLFQPVIQTC